ncbi:hypothetical protein ISF_05215 [Cordyceps fumosorosea ARSEF 2679]|uniref:Uncharacterized protein n=1 Tax=Cordyceps fumosorosea (strain ARSEF 2679) TaxID=1081104 RepID=A0A167V449_CORFA|nr:hypothetical protein ISF_05215 [Cordyceps fumosorosea ARSEF 2679]OAA62206.1 hypothetical protein ISF_05215 [Cordyceps fumosorosea ARSEF 2679]
MAVEEPEEPLHKRGRDDIHVRFAPASYVMKNITQTAIWQVWILWVTASMVALTVTYNGFIYHEPGPDAWFRLGLVMAYATFNVLHACLALRCFKQILDSIGNQACWSLISRIWIFIDRAGAIHEQGTGNKLHVLKQFTCQLLGYTSIETMYKSIPNRRRPKEEAANANERTSQESIDAGLAAGQYLVEEDKTLMASAQEAEKTVKTFIDGEVKSFEKSAESALEKTIVNVAVMLGVCLSTGLAPLTTVRSGDSTAAQLGSYALLLALGTGTAALAASLSHLANARDAANMLLRLQSHMLTLPYDGRSVDARRNTVTMDRDGESPMVRWMDLFFCIRGWRCVLAPFLGPALGLVPLSERRSSAMQDRGYWGEVGQDLRFTVFGSTLEASTRTREVIKKTGMSLRAKVPQRPADAQRPEPAAAEDGTGGIELAEVSSLIR